MHGRTHRAGHGVRDIVELEVEEQPLAGGDRTHAVRPLGREELLAQLDPADQPRDRTRKRRGAGEIRRVERHEDTLSGVHITHGGSRSGSGGPRSPRNRGYRRRPGQLRAWCS